jgi:hypothetical protein
MVIGDNQVVLENSQTVVDDMKQHVYTYALLTICCCAFIDRVER